MLDLRSRRSWLRMLSLTFADHRTSSDLSEVFRQRDPHSG